MGEGFIIVKISKSTEIGPLCHVVSLVENAVVISLSSPFDHGRACVVCSEVSVLFGPAVVCMFGQQDHVLWFSRQLKRGQPANQSAHSMFHACVSPLPLLCCHFARCVCYEALSFGWCWIVFVWMATNSTELADWSVHPGEPCCHSC